MKKIFASASLLLLTLNSAWAAPTLENSKNFAGPAIAIGGSSVGTNSTFKYYNDNTTPKENSQYSVGDNQFIAVVNASYLKDVTDKFLIGGGITYDLNQLKDKSAHLYNSIVGTYDTTIQTKDHISLYVQPTYALSETTALFIKASYHQAKLHLNDQFLYSNLGEHKKDMHGFGIGFGAMIFLDKNIFTKLELEYVDYSKITFPYNSGQISYKLNTTSGTLSIGYRF